jgi:hypothetical protein
MIKNDVVPLKKPEGLRSNYWPRTFAASTLTRDELRSNTLPVMPAAQLTYSLNQPMTEHTTGGYSGYCDTMENLGGKSSLSQLRVCSSQRPHQNLTSDTITSIKWLQVGILACERRGNICRILHYHISGRPPLKVLSPPWGRDGGGGGNGIYAVIRARTLRLIPIRFRGDQAQNGVLEGRRTLH